MENKQNTEVFKGIQGYPDYQISNKGRIWNTKSNKYLKPSKKPNGYYQINLVAINGKRKKEYVHRLVALTFIPNPENKPEVNHIDLDRGNNNLENLEWVNRDENMRKSSRPVPIMVYKGDEFIGEYPCIRDATNTLKLTEANVSMCLSENYKQRTHRGYKFIRLENTNAYNL